MNVHIPFVFADNNTMYSSRRLKLLMILFLFITAYGFAQDADGDGVLDAVDICPGSDDNADNDGDGLPDGCDLDDDNDGILDTVECPFAFNVLPGDLVLTNTILQNITDVTFMGELNFITDQGGNMIDGLEFTDITPGVSFVIVETFTGDQSAAIDNFLRFGIRAVDNGGDWFEDGGPTQEDIRLVSGTTVLTFDEDTGVYGDTQPADLEEVFQYTIPLNAATFGTDTATFNTVMSNLDRIEIKVEFFSGFSGAEGFLFEAGGLLEASCDDIDTDMDGLPDVFDLDSDNDGIYGVVEAGGTDADNDGIADGAVDPATGIPASAGTGLTPIDTLNDGSFDFQNQDSDGDGCSDANEAFGDPNADGGDGGSFGTGEPQTDVDGDGLLNGADYSTGTNSAVTDPSDGGIACCTVETPVISPN